MVRALIFDFDGTILDTETCDFRRWEQLYRSHGRTLRLDEWQQGVGTWDAFDPWAGLPEEVQQRREIVRHELREQILADLSEADLRPGVVDLLDQARDAGLRLAVASSSDRPWVSRWLDHHGLSSRFEAVITRDDVAHVKPDPEPYVKAAAALHVPVGECLAIEDSFHGATSAHRAGMRVVVVPNEITDGQPFLVEWRRLDRLSTLSALLA